MISDSSAGRESRPGSRRFPPSIRPARRRCLTPRPPGAPELPRSIDQGPAAETRWSSRRSVRQSVAGLWGSSAEAQRSPHPDKVISFHSCLPIEDQMQAKTSLSAYLINRSVCNVCYGHRGVCCMRLSVKQALEPGSGRISPCPDVTSGLAFIPNADFLISWESVAPGSLAVSRYEANLS